jgi:hypothetical protein
MGLMAFALNEDSADRFSAGAARAFIGTHHINCS